jgi:hypothetical protein
MSMSGSMRRIRLTVVALALAIPAGLAGAQATTEVIRGRIFGIDSLPLPGVEVLVTGLATRATQTARTDAKGVYTVLFTNPEGEYLVAVRKLGYASTAFRLTRTGISSVLGSDVYLKQVPRLLDTMVVSMRTLPSGERVAIGEAASSALADSLFMADPTQLMNLLLSIPGVYSADSGFSVLGAAANQNTMTLDGMMFRGGALPPDAMGSMRVITSSADPARGGFAGGNVATTLKGGTDIFAATIRGSNSNRALAWSDPQWTRPIPRVINQSGTVNGPIRKGKIRFNVSWNVSDNQTDWYSLLEPRGSLLSQSGISLDTVAAMTSAMRGLGAPLTLTTIPRSITGRNFNSSEVLDFTPNATTSIRVSHNANWNEAVSGATSLTAFPTRANQTGFQAHYLATRFSGYLRGLLNEMNASVSTYSDHSDPFTLLPSASVRVGTDFSDGRTGLAALTFGGGSGEYYETSMYGEVSNELSWLPKSGAHKLKIGGRLAFDRSKFFFFPESNLLGSYTYLTLADLAANRPASYSRVLTKSPRNTHNRNSSLWVGEEWTASKAFQMQGGLRFDFAHPGSRPAYNPEAEQVFGIRTDQIPDDVGVSPRLGFTWSSPARRGQGTASGSSSLGGLSAGQLASMPPELVMSLMGGQRASTLPGIGVSGTIGAYRGSTSTGMIAELVESTGLPGTRVTLSCVGSAVPIPDWRTMTEGPTACADGTTGTTFSIAKPLVRVFDADFRAPLSWRGNLGLDGIRVPGKWILGFNTVFAYNVNGASTIDLNLNRIPGFHLASEDNRPVFVAAEAVVPASGSISPGASRVSPQFSTVQNSVSDLRSYNGQLSASLAPPKPVFKNRVTLSFGYTLARGASESRGTPRIGVTGDPTIKQWVPSTVPLQSFRMNASGRIWWFNFGVSSFVQSGVPLTPLVSGDINGDGSSGNDRAFIPDPAATSDTSLARQLTDLISHARSGARECLTSQLGRMAGANSCRTPWQARVDVSASVTPPSSWGYNDRLRLTMNMLNASGALVRLLRLENTPLGQTTLSTTPNATLLYVTGFDPSTRQFRYRVNQLFGEPTNYGSARRKFAPMQIQMGFEYKFGGPPLNPISRGLGLREPVGQPALTDAQRREAVAKLKRDPVQQIIRLRDSLGLNNDQQAQLADLSVEFNARADEALAPLEKWVLKKGQRLYDQDLSQKLSVAQSALGKLSAEYGKKAQAVLSTEQASRLNEKPKKP